MRCSEERVNKVGSCIIVGAGELYGCPEVHDGDLLIAADGGLSHLKKIGLEPSIIIGDFDSLDRIPSEKDGAEIIRHPVMKDETDTYLAYRVGVERGYREFHIFGGVGGREDHTFANYCLLLSAKREGNDAVLYGKRERTFVLKNEKRELFGRVGADLSVFAIGGNAVGVSISGAKYTAVDIELKTDFPLGVSNSFVDGGSVTITVKQGELLVMQGY